MGKTNESVWRDIRKRSTGEARRKEDDINILNVDELYDYIVSRYKDKVFKIDIGEIDSGSRIIGVDPIEYVFLFTKYDKIIGGLSRIVISWSDVKFSGDFLIKLNDRFKVTKSNQFRFRMNITEKDGSCTNQTYIDLIDIFVDNINTCVVNESVWGDIRKRSTGETIRKEDNMNEYDFLMLRETAKMFRNVIQRSNNRAWRNTCDDFIKYVLQRKEEHFWNDTPDEMYDKVIRFTKENWGDCIGIKEFIEKYLNNLNECDGIPNGLTPSDVGGMGNAHFPGPNGEPGSGDLPTPTGKVYQQVAPFGIFVNSLYRKKKRKKKFRKEDEPCAHSPNAKIYNYVDDYREYVDRTYNQIDRK